MEINILQLFIIPVLVSLSSTVAETFIDINGCGTEKSCFFTPPGCEDYQKGNESVCNEMATWLTSQSSQSGSQYLKFKLEGTTKDLGSPFSGHYISIAFSYDDKMGDDYVLECVANPNGRVTAYVSFNDGTHNHRLWNASEEQILSQSGSVLNGRIRCEVNLAINHQKYLSSQEAWKVFDLMENDYILQFARGGAHPKTDKTDIHYLMDGDKFPWVANHKVSLKENVHITSAKHYDIPRSVQYQMTVTHGIFMLFAWWLLAGTSLLFARYFKAMWPKKTMLGTKVWYQMHRNLMVASVVLQCIAFALIFIQAGDFKFCTHACKADDYSLYLHTVLGVAATAAALIQPFLAWIRPTKDEPTYKIFLWVHWSLGLGSWILAAVVIFLTPTLGKTALRYNFGFNVDYLMTGYICVFIASFVSLEIVVQLSEKPKHKQAGKSDLPNIGFGPPKEIGVPVGKPVGSDPNYSNWRFLILLLFISVSTVICCCLSYQLIYNLRRKGII